MRVVKISEGKCAHADPNSPLCETHVGNIYTVVGIVLMDDGGPDGYDFAEFPIDPEWVFCSCQYRDIDEDNEEMLRLIKIKEDA